MSCPKCQAEMIKSKAGSMCLECGYADGLKPLAAAHHPAEIKVERTAEGHPIPEAFQVEATPMKPAEEPVPMAPAHKPTAHHSKS